MTGVAPQQPRVLVDALIFADTDQMRMLADTHAKFATL